MVSNLFNDDFDCSICINDHQTKENIHFLFLMLKSIYLL